MSQSGRHGECVESLPQATRVSTECRDIPRNMSRHTAIAASAYLNPGITPKSPSHGNASHANLRLPRTRKIPPRWLGGLSSIPDRPVKKEMGQIDSLRRENDKCEMGTTSTVPFGDSAGKSVLQITVRVSLDERNTWDLEGALSRAWRFTGSWP